MPEMIRLKKMFGQNFIQSDEVVNEIIAAFGADEDCFVIEIGPGGGALTIPLSESVGHLTAIEVDERLVKILKDEFRGNDKVSIVSKDVLQVDFNEILKEDCAEKYKRLKIAGNIPYNITSPIITKVLTSKVKFENFTLMIQKEVADRICCPPGKSDRGYMSVFVQYYTEPRYVRTVERDLFFPPPNVDSAVVDLKFRDKPPVECDEEKFFDVVKMSFAHKRKTLVNNLTGYAGSDKAKVSSFLSGIGIDPQRRAETLSLQEFADIANTIDELKRA